MATNFPTAKDVLPNPQPTDSVQIVSHATQHTNANDAIEALETKVGIDGSTDPNSLDYKIANYEPAKISFTPPLDGKLGQLWFDNQTAEFYVFDGTYWVQVATPVGADGSVGPAGPGVPTGGTTGQYLVKTSSSDYATAWSTLDITELVQDTIGSNLGSGLTYNDTSGAIGVDPGAMLNQIVGGTSGNSYGLVGTSDYLDVKDTNGYNKEIELDIVAVETKLNTDGYLNTSNIVPLTLTQSSNNASYPLTISSANQQGGGAGYSDILKLVNTKSGATNINKFFRLTDSGSLEIVNSAYSATIFSIGNDGALTAVASVNGSAIGDSGWIEVSSFANNFSSVAPVAYRKINNVVYMRGNVTGGTSGTGAFTLPSGYRPSDTTVIPSQQYGTGNISYVTIGTDGVVVPNASSSWLTSLVFPV